MIIRRLQTDDIDAVMHVRVSVRSNAMTEAELAEVGITRQSLADGLRDGATVGWCAELDGVVVGFSLVFAEPREVNALFVTPDAEGRGIGSQLLNAATAWLQARSDAPIHLCTGADTPAYRFYRRRGWHDTGRDEKFGRVLTLE